MSDHANHDHDPETPEAHASRRAILQAAIGAGVGATLLSTLYIGAGLIPKKEVTPETEPLAKGDILVYGDGPKKGQPVNPANLGLGEQQTVAYPMNPKTRVVKDKEANNTVLLLKLDPASLDAETAKSAAEGVVAYSAVCKHLGCIVSNWDKAAQILVCPCHQGRYDPKQSAKVVGGPPPKPVPQLPIKIEGGQILAAAGFLAKPGKEV